MYRWSRTEVSRPLEGIVASDRALVTGVNTRLSHGNVLGIHSVVSLDPYVSVANSQYLCRVVLTIAEIRYDVCLCSKTLLALALKSVLVSFYSDGR